MNLIHGALLIDWRYVSTNICTCHGSWHSNLYIAETRSFYSYVLLRTERLSSHGTLHITLRSSLLLVVLLLFVSALFARRCRRAVLVIFSSNWLSVIVITCILILATSFSTLFVSFGLCNLLRLRHLGIGSLSLLSSLGLGLCLSFCLSL